MQARAAEEGIGGGGGIPLVKRWLMFNLVGGLGIIVQLAVLAALTGPMRWNYLIATAAAVEAAVLHNFFWHEHWTWAERTGGGTASWAWRLARFHLANGAFSLVGNMLLMGFFVGRLSMNYSLANLLAIAICSVLNFLAGDRVVFPAGAPRVRGGAKCRGGI